MYTTPLAGCARQRLGERGEKLAADAAACGLALGLIGRFRVLALRAERTRQRRPRPALERGEQAPRGSCPSPGRRARSRTPGPRRRLAVSGAANRWGFPSRRRRRPPPRGSPDRRSQTRLPTWSDRPRSLLPVGSADGFFEKALQHWNSPCMNRLAASELSGLAGLGRGALLLPALAGLLTASEEPEHQNARSDERDDPQGNRELEHAHARVSTRERRHQRA